MKRVFSSDDPTAISVVRSKLADAGIETQVLNEHMPSVSGEVPFFLALPEVWIEDDAEFDRAVEIVSQHQSGAAEPAPTAAAWTCPRCGREIEAQFSECWHCTAENDPDPQ